MRKTYLSLLILAMTMVSMVANAQYKAEITTDPVEDYVAGYVNFDPIEIATALGTDTATLHKAISASGNYYIQTADGRSNEYTGNKDLNEFWMDNNGNPVGWGNGNTWFSGLEYIPAGTDPETGATWSDSVYISFGQMPGVFKKIYTPSVLKATTYLVVGEKEISFEIIQNINAAPEPTLPAAVTTLSKLTIVKDYELVLPFIVGKSYEGKTYSATLDGIYEALGVSQAELDASVADYVYTQVVTSVPILTEDGEESGEYIYSLADSLALPEVAAGGAWYGRYMNYNEATATEEPLSINAPMGWGAGHNTFYTQAITLAEGEYSIVSGQYPGMLVEGDTDYTYHYIVAGDKAARIKISVKMEVPEVVDPNQMVKVGETTIQVSADIDNNYATKGFTIDMEAIVAALGCTTDDLVDVYAYAQDGSFSDNHTEGSGGFYYNADGKIENWGSNASCFIARTSTSLQDGAYTIGQMSGAFKDITEDTTVKPQLIFQFGQNYYIVTVEYTVKAPKQSDEEIVFTKVAEDVITIQIIPEPSNGVYAWGTTSTIDIDFVESKIGTRDFTLYTDKYTAPAEGETEGTWSYTKDYTCTPAPGFWYATDTYENKEGKYVVNHSGWGNNSFGLTYASGVITWYQYPGLRSAGDAYSANLYAVNEETGAYVLYNLYVEYVETVVETEIAGEEDVIAAIDNPEDLTYTKVDLTAAATALGIDNPDLFGSAEVKILKNSITYTSEFYDASMGWYLDENGWCYDLNNNADAAMTAPVNLGYDWDFASYDFNFFTTAMGDAPADGVIYSTKVALEYDSKLYIFNVKIMNRETANGIENIDAANKVNAGNVYDLSGRLVRKNATSVKGLANGVYLLNGKKYIVK